MTGGLIHPWRLLRSLAHVTLRWHDGGPAGLTTFATNTISLRRGLNQAERRCTLMHELIHIHRGPAISTLAEREELRVDREASRMMLPDIRAVGEALAWADHDLGEAADELWVDQGTLRIRLENLHPAERHYLTQRLAD